MYVFLLFALRTGLFAEGRFLGKVLDEWVDDLQEFVRTKLPRLILLAIVAFILSRLLGLVTAHVVQAAERHAVRGGRVPQVKTLAGIVRTTGFAIIITLVGLQFLAALGVNLGPLLASAGVAGVAIGLAGIVVLSLNTMSFSATVRPMHVIAVLAAGIGWSFGTLLQRRYVPSHRVQGFSCLQMLSGGLFQLLMSLIDQEWVDFHPSRIELQSILAVLYLVVFGSLIAVNCYSFLVAHVSAQKVTTYALVNPVIALALGAIVLHEKITPSAILSTVLVLLGVALVLFQRRPAQPLSAGPALASTAKSN